VSKTVRDLMKTDVVTAELTTSMSDLQRMFMTARVGALPIVDRDDKMCGIVSRSDVVRKFAVEQSLAEMLEKGFDPVEGKDDDAHDLEALDAIGSAVGRRLAKMTVKDIMIADVVTIHPDVSLEDAATRMIEKRIHRLPVVEDECLVGMISAFDFMSLYSSAPKS
jgi:CBS domain-containing protein